jgi:nitrite reductase (NADH) small subunit
MIELTTVCKLEELTPYSGTCALVNGEQVALFRMDEGDTVYAIGNYDPIGKASVLSRGLVGDIEGQPVVASPLYKQHFNLKTGECLQEEGVSVPAYVVTIEAGDVKVAV